MPTIASPAPIPRSLWPSSLLAPCVPPARSALVLALALSTLWTTLLCLSFYPGLIANDSIQRLWVSTTYLDAGQAPTARVPDGLFDDLFPPFMSIVLTTLKATFGSWGISTVLQAWCFASSLLLLSMLILGQRLGLVVSSLLLCVPPVWNHAVAMLPDAWTATSLHIAALALLWPAHASPHDERRAWLSRSLRVAALLIAIYFALGFRFNALTTLPAFLIAGVLLAKHHRLGAPVLAAPLLALALSITTTRSIPANDIDPTAQLLAWEHTGMLVLAGQSPSGPSVIAKHSLDPVMAKQGTTQRALAAHSWDTSHTIVFGSNPPLSSWTIRRLDFSARVRKAYKAFILDRPDLFVRMKLRHWGMVLGMREGGYYFVGHNVPDWATWAGVEVDVPPSFQSRRQAVSDWGRSLTTRTLPLWMPYTALLATLLVLPLRFVANSRRTHASKLPAPLTGHAQSVWTSPAFALMLIAAAYYGAFFIYAPGFEWRYYLPSFTLIVIALVAMLRDTLAILSSPAF